jgi:hypothetical protein
MLCRSGAARLRLIVCPAGVDGGTLCKRGCCSAIVEEWWLLTVVASRDGMSEEWVVEQDVE